jgi:hypothetical protein
MKEVIMKKLLFWIVLIVGTVVLLGSCAKKKDDDTAVATSCAGSTSLTEVSSCSATPSGSITGIDNATLTGVVSTFHAYGILGGYGVNNSTDCIDNATLIASSTSSVPSGTSSMIMNRAITSSSTYAERQYYYSDSSCETEIASLVFGKSDFTVGDSVQGLSTSVGGKTFPSTASKVTYKETCLGLKGSTDAGVTWLKTFFGDDIGIDPTVGTSYTCANDDTQKSAFVFVDNSSSLRAVYGSNFVYWDTAATTNWTSGGDTLTTLP